MNSDFADIELENHPVSRRRDPATAVPKQRLSRDYLMDPRIPKAPRLPKTLLREVRELSGEPLPDYRNEPPAKTKTERTLPKGSRSPRAHKRPAKADDASWPAFAIVTALCLALTLFSIVAHP